MYKGTLIAVSDMDKSKRFYHDVLGMNVVGDFGANVQLDGGLFLQTLNTWTDFIGGREVYLHGNAGELYFEVADMDKFIEMADKASVNYVHKVVEHSWGQRAVRFYDPDGHIVEVAEAIGMVIERFSRSGLTPEQIAKRMDVPVEYVKEML